MLNFIKKKFSSNKDKISTNNNNDQNLNTELSNEPSNVIDSESTNSQNEQQLKASWFSRLRGGLKKTRTTFSAGIANLILGKKQIDDDLLNELEKVLIKADVGTKATKQILEDLTSKVKRKQLNDSNALYEALKADLLEIIKPCEKQIELNDENIPFVILVVGVNGTGKTTTIGKLAKKFKDEGNKVMLAAGDTFRAAATQQLEAWGEQNNIPVIAQHQGADSASVLFDAYQSAKAKNIDILLADTAGRLHTQSNLMDELKKIVRVLKKIDENAPHEIMLVLDASIGQNALNQAKDFTDNVGVSGLTITKLDGTAKGGILFAIAKELKLPIRAIGVGEKAEDLRAFDANDFIDALFMDVATIDDNIQESNKEISRS